MAESQCVASQWDRSGSIVCSFDSLPTIRFCLTLTRHNCANCWPGFWLRSSFKVWFYEYFKEWQKLKMETIHIASAWTNECVSRFDLRLGRCRFWIAHCAKPCHAMHCNALQCIARQCKAMHCTRIEHTPLSSKISALSHQSSWAFILKSFFG